MACRRGAMVRGAGFRVEPIDTTGAGDSFDAGFLYAHLIERLQVDEALRFANACGALSTLGYGGTAAQPSREQVVKMLRAEEE